MRVKDWDPTRPILYNGGDNPGGVADIISLHYPHELPYWNRYPMDVWWLKDVIPESGLRISNDEKRGKDADPIRSGCITENGGRGAYIDTFWYHKPDYCWRWDKKQPLDLGEIGYFSGGRPHMDAILLGDTAYSSPLDARDATRAMVWAESIDAARAMDVALINPWNPPAGERANKALKEAFKPVRLILYPG